MADRKVSLALVLEFGYGWDVNDVRMVDNGC